MLAKYVTSRTTNLSLYVHSLKRAERVSISKHKRSHMVYYMYIHIRTYMYVHICMYISMSSCFTHSTRTPPAGICEACFSHKKDDSTKHSLCTLRYARTQHISTPPTHPVDGRGFCRHDRPAHVVCFFFFRTVFYFQLRIFRTHLHGFPKAMMFFATLLTYHYVQLFEHFNTFRG